MADKELKFPVVKRDLLLRKLMGLEVTGRPLRSRRAIACRMCKRDTRPLGRVAFIGCPLCSDPWCQLCPSSAVTKLFPTPYGTAVHLPILAIFCRVMDDSDKLFVQRQPIVERAEALTDAYINLLDWQKAYDSWERYSHPADYEAGRVKLVPPRRIDEVMALRAVAELVPLDPTARLPSETALLIKKVRREGPAALMVPF